MEVEASSASMDSTSSAAWTGPFGLQLAKNWAAEVAPADDAQVWAPAVGHPLQYASVVDIFDSSYSHQPYVVPDSSYSSGGQKHLVEYNSYNYYAAAAQHHDPDMQTYIDPYPMETNIDPDTMETFMNNPEELFQERKEEFEYDANLMETKMHRYPRSIQALGDWCTVPKVVAIGPYYHGRDHLQNAEKMKHVAAAYCIQVVNNNSGLLVQDFYDKVVSIVEKIGARCLYDKDVMEGISYEDDFLPMMFYDACFLVIYIHRKSGAPLDTDMRDFFLANNDDIALDIMLLENQIPLELVGEVMNMCTADALGRMRDFISVWQRDGFLRKWIVPGSTRDDWYQGYYNKAPHLLGLLRFYAVGKGGIRSRELMLSSSELNRIESLIPVSASPVELAQMGIFLTANETTELLEMRLRRKLGFLAKLSMAPLSLNEACASWLVNMAAVELCTTTDFFDQGAAEADSAVCSYLLLLSMLVNREEDVHALRTNGILKGSGLSNNNTLEFFTSLQSLRRGLCYARVMLEISDYRNESRHTIAVRVLFVRNNWKYFVGVASAIAGIISIVSTLKELNGN